MQEKPNRRRKPGIVVGKTDHERLTKLTASLLERMLGISEKLDSELDRARVVEDSSVPTTPSDRVGGGLQDGHREREDRGPRLSVPSRYFRGKGSIVTPIGTALIGLKTGQSISWTARDGHRYQLVTVGQLLAE